MSPFSLQLAGSLLHLVAIASGASLYANQTGLCQQIDSQFPGHVSYSGSAAYISSQSNYYTGEERELQPGCVFRPTKTSDVSHFLKLVAASKTTSTPEFAFRCGGHSFFAGAANIDGGVTIDLRSLDSFQLSADQKTASVGGGSIWSENVYPNLVPYNLTVAGGRITGVGVGGFVTGGKYPIAQVHTIALTQSIGGLNYLERRNGFACDNIYGYEVVLGTGEVVYASADSNRDLWLALKGGSNNFGIVTRFDLATHSQGLMLGGYINFNVTQTVLDDHAKAFSSWMDPHRFDPLAVTEFNLVWAGGAWSLADAIYYLAPDLTPSVYEGYFSIPGQTGNNLALKNVTAIVEESAALVPTTVSRQAFSFKNIFVDHTNSRVVSQRYPNELLIQERQCINLLSAV